MSPNVTPYRKNMALDLKKWLETDIKQNLLGISHAWVTGRRNIIEGGEGAEKVKLCKAKG